jgi:hypothetical protein
MRLSTRFKIILLAATVVGVTLLVTVKYTSACRLSKVTYNSSEISGWDAKYGLDDSSPLISQPVDSLARELITKRSIFKVDISYKFPQELDIRTNNFDPVSFLADRYSGQLYGVLKSGRIVDLDNCEVDWEHPVLTSVGAGRLFGHSEDDRVDVVVRQLQQIREKTIDLYRLIDEIDFGNSNFLKVSVAGLPYRLKVHAETLADDIHKFVEFVSRFNPDLSDVTLMDLRFDDMIICARGKH